MSRSDLRVVEAWQDAVNRGDVAAAEETCADRVEVAGPRGATTMAAGDLGTWMTRSGFTATALRRFCRSGGTVVVEQQAAWCDPATGEVSGAVVATCFRVVGGFVASLARHDTLAAALDDAGFTTDDEVVAPT